MNFFIKIILFFKREEIFKNNNDPQSSYYPKNYLKLFSKNNANENSVPSPCLTTTVNVSSIPIANLNSNNIKNDVANIPSTASVIPPPPPLPIPKLSAKSVLNDLQARAKTVRIGKVRWPPPLRDTETFENELQR